MRHSFSLTTCFLRAAASYRLLEPEALQHPLPPWLAAQATHPAFGGLLIPVHDDFRVQRVVTRATARLFRSLTRPRRAPPSLPSRALCALVLDGVLELRAGPGYVSGAAAHRYCLPAGNSPEPRSAIGILSLGALRESAALGLPSSGVLARLLYSYNRLPATPAWWSRYPDPLSLERELRQAVRRRAGLHGPAATGGGSWLSWERVPPPRGGARTWKLYLSPMPDHLVPALEAALRQRDAFAIKVGRNLASILRPDKLVLYFGTARQLGQAARQLGRDLAGLPAQGVPFTGQAGESALLSWGLDHAGQGEAASWRGDDSWRAWLTQRLATALVQALRDPGCRMEPWRYARDRVSLDGVDPRDWTLDRRSAVIPEARHGDH